MGWSDESNNYIRQHSCDALHLTTWQISTSHSAIGHRLIGSSVIGDASHRRSSTSSVAVWTPYGAGPGVQGSRVWMGMWCGFSGGKACCTWGNTSLVHGDHGDGGCWASPGPTGPRQRQGVVRQQKSLEAIQAENSRRSNGCRNRG